MKPAFRVSLAIALLTGAASAQVTGFATLFSGGTRLASPGNGVLGDAVVTEYAMPVAGGSRLRLSTTAYFDVRPGRPVTGAELAAQTQRNTLSAGEVKALSTSVNAVARKCFNLLPERAPAIAAWIARMNAGSSTTATTTFGPLKVTFYRELMQPSGQWWTNIAMERSGNPGTAPWNSYCQAR